MHRRRSSMNQYDSDWTPQDVDTLRELAAQGWYARDIAYRMQRTRNQIIGKCRRLHIKLKHRQVPGVRQARKSRAKGTNGRRVQKGTVMHKQEVPIEEIKTEPQPLHLTVVELTLHTCRWPFGERYPFTFCGHPIPKFGQAYCHYHQQKSQP